MITIFLPWFFITPIFYTLDQLPGLEGNEWVADLIYYVNFVTPFVEAIRDPIFFGEFPDLGDVVYCVVAGRRLADARRARRPPDGRPGLGDPLA